MKAHWLISLLIFTLHLRLHAQMDSISLNEVVISAPQLRLQSIGQAVVEIDSSIIKTYRSEHLGDVLRAAGLNVRSYGASTLSTVGMRGSTANQTLILWNGFKLQSPLSGLTDLSSFGLAIFDQIALAPGANSALWGSSAVGGVVHLSHHGLGTPQSIAVEGSIGSFGFNQLNGKLNFNSGRWKIGLIASKQSVLNDYTYKILPDTKEYRVTNGASKSENGVLQLGYQMGKHHTLSYFFWMNGANRSIPALTTQTRSVAIQDDFGARNALVWSYRKGQELTEFRLGHFREDIDYSDSLAGVRSEIGFKSTTLEYETKVTLKHKISVHFGGGAYRNRALALGFEDGITEWRSALFTSVRYGLKQFSAQADIRQEWLSDKPNNTTPGVGISYASINTQWVFNARINRAYKNATLNDLYWQPGGNRDLRPETGWTRELGARFSKQAGKSSLSLQSTFFSRDMRDLIYWSPVSGSFNWSPSNIAHVQTNGLENRLTYRIALRQNLSLKANFGYDLTRAINQITIAIPAISKGEQLWYIPEHQYFTGLEFEYKNYQLRYNRNWSDAVRTPESGLAAVGLDGLTAYAPIRLRGKFPLYAYCRVDNLANRTWFSVDRRPMPGRSFRIGLGVHLEEEKK
jgi:vitamin B12 transporter